MENEAVAALRELRDEIHKIVHESVDRYTELFCNLILEREEDEDQKGKDVEEVEMASDVVDSDIERDSKAAGPDEEPPQKVGDPLVVVVEENQDDFQEARVKAMEATSEGKFKSELIEAELYAKGTFNGVDLYKCNKKPKSSGRIRSVSELDEKGCCRTLIVGYMELSSAFVSGTLTEEEKMGGAQNVFDRMSKCGCGQFCNIRAAWNYAHKLFDVLLLCGLRQLNNEWADWIDAQKLFDVILERGFAGEVHGVLMGDVGEHVVAGLERTGIGDASFIALGPEGNERDIIVVSMKMLREAAQSEVHDTAADLERNGPCIVINGSLVSNCLFSVIKKVTSVEGFNSKDKDDGGVISYGEVGIATFNALPSTENAHVYVKVSEDGTVIAQLIKVGFNVREAHVHPPLPMAVRIIGKQAIQMHDRIVMTLKKKKMEVDAKKRYKFPTTIFYDFNDFRKEIQEINPHANMIQDNELSNEYCIVGKVEAAGIFGPFSSPKVAEFPVGDAHMFKRKVQVDATVLKKLPIVFSYYLEDFQKTFQGQYSTVKMMQDVGKDWDRKWKIDDTLLESPQVRKITFTGSTAVGKKLMAGAAKTVKKVSLELGGNAPCIVFDDADLDVAVIGALAAKFRDSGQTCVCVNRIIVQEGIYEKFANVFSKAVQSLQVGDGFSKGVALGPLINEAAFKKVESFVEDTISKGAKVLLGGRRRRLGMCFYEPTVISDVNSKMFITREEVFGPVAPLLKFKTEEEAISIANDINAGLATYLFTIYTATFEGKVQCYVIVTKGGAEFDKIIAADFLLVLSLVRKTIVTGGKILHTWRTSSFKNSHHLRYVSTSNIFVCRSVLWSSCIATSLLRVKIASGKTDSSPEKNDCRKDKLYGCSNGGTTVAVGENGIAFGCSVVANHSTQYQNSIIILQFLMYLNSCSFSCSLRTRNLSGMNCYVEKSRGRAD